MVGKREFLICDVFARARFEGNQLAVFVSAAGLTDEEMQALAREMHFSETTFILDDRPTDKGWPVRIFTPAREVPFAGHPTLGTAWVIWDRFLSRKTGEVRLDLKVGTVPVAIEDKGELLVMTQVAPESGGTATPAEAAEVLGLGSGDIDNGFPCQEVSTGLWFLVVPVKSLAAMQGIKVNLSAYSALIERMQAKAVLAFCPETVDPENDLHVRVFCDFYDVPEDPATGSANGCLCAWLVRHRFTGSSDVKVKTEQGVEMKRPSQLHLFGRETDTGIEVRIGGRVVLESWLRIEGHEKTRVEAAAALVRLGRPTHARPVLEYHALLDPTPPKNKVQAVNAFFRSSGEPVLFGTVVDTLHTVSRYMHNILNAGEPYMRARALEWLYTTGVNSDKGIALEEATLIMESRDEGARATAFKVVMMLGTDEAEERIDKATYDWQPDIRFMASRYLAEQKQDKEPDGQ